MNIDIQKLQNNKIFNTFLYLAFIVYLLFLAKVLFFKYPFYGFTNPFYRELTSLKYSINLVPFQTILIYLFDAPSTQVALRNLLGNIVIFLPLGFLLPLLKLNKYRFKNVFPIAISTSFGAELIQIGLGLGSFDIDDIILNTLGASLGYLLYKKITQN